MKIDEVLKEAKKEIPLTSDDLKSKTYLYIQEQLSKDRANNRPINRGFVYIFSMLILIIAIITVAVFYNDKHKIIAFEFNSVETTDSNWFGQCYGPDYLHGYIIHNKAELILFHEKYSTILDIEKYNDKFFNQNALIMVEFFYSTSDYINSFESDIGIREPLKVDKDKLIVTVDVKSSKDGWDMDINHVVFVISVANETVKEIKQIVIEINNTAHPDSPRSAYYRGGQ